MHTRAAAAFLSPSTRLPALEISAPGNAPSMMRQPWALMLVFDIAGTLNRRAL